MYSKLFEPIKIGNLELKNRLIVPAMSTLTATTDGACTEQFIAYHERKAQGGWGLVVTEYFGIKPNAGFFPRMLGIWNDELIESHRQLTDRVHAVGGKIAAQISHAGRETFTGITDENLVAPSPYRDVDGHENPRELTIPEIKEIVELYGDTALNLKKAGFDAVEIYAAHGYLISEFLSSYANKRIDEYGGTLENRCRFLLEIVENIRKKVGADYPVMIRLSVEEYMPGGLSIAETRVIAMKLEQAGIDAISCSQGIFTNSYNIVEPSYLPPAVFVNNAEEIKKVVNIPVITAGRITEGNIALSVLESGKADIIGMGRASLADPDFPNKLKEGKLSEIRHCIGCVQGCIGENMRANNCHCLVNPLIDREYELKITEAKVKKNIFIAGAGVTGCEAAIVAAERGHNVTLFEKADRIGGQWHVAALPPGKAEFLTFLQWQLNRLNDLGVKIHYNTELTVDMVKEAMPDEVFIATGSTPFIPPIKGVEKSNVVQANDVLLQKCRVGKNVVVAGGGSVGIETAEFISLYGSDVTIVEMRDEILIGCERETKLMLQKSIKNHGIKVLTSSKVCEIGDDTVILERKGKKVILEEIDTVVIAAGSRPFNTLEEPIKALGIPTRVIGDCKEVRNGLKDIYEGFMAGYEV